MQKHVMVIEDDTSLQNVYTHFFKGRGYGVLPVSNGSAGVDVLKALGNNKPDVIITDIVMPEMDGITFVNHPTVIQSNIPIVMMSNLCDNVKKSTVINPNVVSWLVKLNTSLAQLESEVLQAIEGHDHEAHKCTSCGQIMVHDRRGEYLGGSMCESDKCPAGQPNVIAR